MQLPLIMMMCQVEDRRIEAEKKLISLEVVCEGQKQQLENMRLQLRSLKVGYHVITVLNRIL